MWRQCDCLSCTMNYFQDNNSFFHPSVHNLGRASTGKAISDFPIIYFLVAQLWKIFGYHEFIYRLFILVIFFSGLFALFKIFENSLKDSILGIIFSLLLFTSPVIVYYANNFLMDIPAFSMSIIGLYFFLKYYESAKNKHFYLFIGFYILAGLLKITSLITYISIFGLFILELFGIELGNRKKIFQHPLKQSILLISVFVIQFIWYWYAVYYNKENNNHIFPIRALPIWGIDIPEIMLTLDFIKHHINNDYFRAVTQLVFIFMFVSVLVFNKKSSKIMLLLTIALSIGLLFFTVFFFEALKRHDYYVITQFILIQIIILNFLLLLKTRIPHIYNSIFFRIVIILFVIYNAAFAEKALKKRYSANGWQNHIYIETIKPFDDIRPYLDSIGINPDDKVICISDNSINVSLYKMNLKGWTNYGIWLNNTIIEEKIDLGAKYLFISNKEIYENKNIKPFINKKTGEYKNVDIFKLSY